MSAKADIWMPLYIGDYLRDTTRLTTAQHGAYMLLIMDYWTNGAPPDDDAVLASITKSTIDDWAKIRTAIVSKFQIEDGFWRHSRIDRELAEAQENKQKRLERSHKANLAKAAKVSNKDTYEVTSKVTPSPSPSPSPENTSSSSKKNSATVKKPTEVSDAVWLSFLQVRKAKRAAVTDLAILAIRREAVKAGIPLEDAMTICCERGWASFKAEWWQKETRPALQAESFYEREQRLKRERWEEMTGRKWPTEPGAIIEMDEAELQILGVSK